MCRRVNIMKGVAYILSIFLLLIARSTLAQVTKPVVIPTDSSTEKKNPAFTKDTGLVVLNKDTVKVVPKHNPKTATLRSLIVPGWGQAYNHEYWKIPIVYGALGTVAGFYIYNNTWYKRTRDAFDIRVNRPQDSGRIHPSLLPLTPGSLQAYRNDFRRNRDYSMLYFIIFWGLNIADATVFAHLRQFDVSEDLSLKIDPVIRQNGNAGISFVLGLKSASKSHVFIP